MKTPGSSAPVGHPWESLLPYLEGLLSAEEQMGIEQHLDLCADCSQELTELREMIAALNTHKEIFCPEPWLLHDYACHGEDPGQTVSRHLSSCRWCREETASMGAGSTDAAVPVEVKEVFRAHYATPSRFQPEVQTASGMALLAEYLRSVLRLPVLALGAAVAAVLAIVFIYPRESAPPVVGLSSVTWEEAIPTQRGMVSPKSLTLMGPPRVGTEPSEKRSRIAVILLLSGFDPPMDQARIDSLYRAMGPSADLAQRVDMIDPARIRETLGQDSALSPDAKYLVTRLGRDLSATAALLVRLNYTREKITIETEMIESPTGTPLKKTSNHALALDELAGVVSRSTFELLEAIEPAK